MKGNFYFTIKNFSNFSIVKKYKVQPLIPDLVRLFTKRYWSMKNTKRVGITAKIVPNLMSL